MRNLIPILALISIAGCADSCSDLTPENIDCCECLADTEHVWGAFRFGDAGVWNELTAPCAPDLDTCLEVLTDGGSLATTYECIRDSKLCGFECKSWGPDREIGPN